MGPLACLVRRPSQGPRKSQRESPRSGTDRRQHCKYLVRALACSLQWTVWARAPTEGAESFQWTLQGTPVVPSQIVPPLKTLHPTSHLSKTPPSLQCFDGYPDLICVMASTRRTQICNSLFLSPAQRPSLTSIVWSVSFSWQCPPYLESNPPPFLHTRKTWKQEEHMAIVSARRNKT
jgi:hypothetical protein